MSGRIDQRLRDLGLTVPEPAPPAGAYVPFVVVQSLAFIAGQLPIVDGRVAWRGQLGGERSLDDGIAAARICALNLIAQVRAACDGDLDRVVRAVRLAGFVNAVPGFADHPKVINGASDLMLEIFGDAGRHARAAVGCSSLPLDAAVEVDGIFQIR
jgi:enamine deaminase RidA (YjgF/YER057c/UK114 family)